MVRSMRISDIFLPQKVKCIFCNSEVGNYGVCDSCYDNLPWIKGRTCNKCGGHVKGDEIICQHCKDHDHEFGVNYSIFDYDKVIAKAIVEFKQMKFKYIGEVLSEIVYDYYEKMEMDYDIIIPMPIHFNRMKTRGFNQAEILSSKIASNYQGLVDNTILIRVKDTPHQTGLSRKNRLDNLFNAFKIVDKDKIKDKRILIIDDIYTTGTTLDECASTLLFAGAKSVDCLCLARGRVYEDKKVID